MIDNTVQARELISELEYAILGVQAAGNLDRVTKAKAALAAALTAPAAVEGWQPIETAPSGTAASILIGTEGYPGSTGEAFWHDGSECHGHRGGAGWFWESDRAHLLTASNATGTHWCYPPTPPGAAPSATAPVVELGAQAGREAAEQDAARWRTFIGLPYAIRAEWAANLSMSPVLTQWVDQATQDAARATQGDSNV